MLLYISQNKKRRPQVLTTASILEGADNKGQPPPPPKSQTVRAKAAVKTMAQPQCQQPKNIETNTKTATVPPATTKVLLKQPTELPPPPPKRDSPASSPILPKKDLSEKKKKSHNARRGHVRFNSVELKEYSVTLGDHPLCKVLPLTLDWSHSTPVEFSINDYEASRTAKFELHMDVRHRFERLTLVSGLDEHTVARLEQRRRKSVRQSE